MMKFPAKYSQGLELVERVCMALAFFSPPLAIFVALFLLESTDEELQRVGRSCLKYSLITILTAGLLIAVVLVLLK